MNKAHRANTATLTRRSYLARHSTAMNIQTAKMESCCITATAIPAVLIIVQAQGTAPSIKQGTQGQHSHTHSQKLPRSALNTDEQSSRQNGELLCHSHCNCCSADTCASPIRHSPIHQTRHASTQGQHSHAHSQKLPRSALSANEQSSRQNGKLLCHSHCNSCSADNCASPRYSPIHQTRHAGATQPHSLAEATSLGTQRR
jgi:hypothetical protein